MNQSGPSSALPCRSQMSPLVGHKSQRQRSLEERSRTSRQLVGHTSLTPQWQLALGDTFPFLELLSSW